MNDQTNHRDPAHLLDDDGAAEFLSIDSPRTLEGWRRRDVGPPYFKIGGSIRYSLDDLEQWLAACRHDPASDSGPAPHSGASEYPNHHAAT